MKNFSVFVTLTSMIAFGASGALADGSMRDFSTDMRGCSSGPFAGFYAGASVGYASHEDDKDDQFVPNNRFGDEEGSVAGGVHYGYNWQCDRVVFGFESDIGLFSAETSQIDPTQPETRLESDIDWFSTSRLRFGLVHDNSTLFYVTGGLAYADVSHKVSTTLFNGYSKTNDGGQWGWTVGGGIEFLRSDRWLLRAEALYVDLGSETETYTVTAADGCQAVTCQARYDWENDFWVARIGLSYKFGGREEEVVPLK